MKYMNMQVPAPCGWDARLKKQYGDYMTPRHEASLHGEMIFDPYHPYDGKTDIVTED